NRGVILNTLDAALQDSSSLHEHTHQMTLGNEQISEYATKIYQEGVIDEEAYQQLQLEHKGLFPGSYEYFIDPTELDARKKVLEREMELLGIKKYGEEFTEEHYSKLMELIDTDQ